MLSCFLAAFRFHFVSISILGRESENNEINAETKNETSPEIPKTASCKDYYLYRCDIVVFSNVTRRLHAISTRVREEKSDFVDLMIFKRFLMNSRGYNSIFLQSTMSQFLSRINFNV